MTPQADIPRLFNLILSHYMTEDLTPYEAMRRMENTPEVGRHYPLLWSCKLCFGGAPRAVAFVEKGKRLSVFCSWD